jgi:hypothetical protein
MNSARRAKSLLWYSLPLTARTQHIHNALKDAAIGDGFAPAADLTSVAPLPVSLWLRYKRFHTFPERIRYLP